MKNYRKNVQEKQEKHAMQFFSGATAAERLVFF